MKKGKKTSIIFFYSRFEVQLFSGVLAENCLPKTYAPQDLLLIIVKKKKHRPTFSNLIQGSTGALVFGVIICVFFFVSTALKILPLQSSVPQESNTITANL